MLNPRQLAAKKEASAYFRGTSASALVTEQTLEPVLKNVVGWGIGRKSKGKRMCTIFQAKEDLGARCRSEKGFVGVGIGRYGNSDALRVYVEDANSSIAQKLRSEEAYEGFPIIVEVTGKIRAFSA